MLNLELLTKIKNRIQINDYICNIIAKTTKLHPYSMKIAKIRSKLLKTLPFYMCFITLILTSSISYAQSKQFSFSGKVIDKANGEILPGAIVFIHETGKNSTCNEQGEFKLDQLTKGVYHIHVQLMSYEPFAQNFTVLSDTFVVISLEPTSIELKNFTLESSLLKTEHVKNSQDIENADKDFLIKNSGNTFANTLEKMPGIRSMNVGVGIAKPVIRGMSFNRVTVTENGIKQEGQQWGSDHGLEIDQFNVERIEVIKGPASLIYGSDAMAGVINILPPIIPFEGKFNSEILGLYRSNNQNWGGSVLTEFNKKRNFFRARMTWQEFGDYTVPTDSFTYNGYHLPIYHQRLKNTAGKELNFSISGGAMRDWGSVRITVSRYGQTAGLFPGAMGRPRAYNLSDDGNSRNIDLPQQINEHLKALLNINFKLKKGWWENDFGVQLNNRLEKSFAHAHGNGNIFNPANDTALQLQLLTVSFNSRIHHNYNPRLKSIVGFSGQYMDNRINGFEFLIPEYYSVSGGAYYFIQYSIRENWTFNSGVRLDYAHMDLKGFTLPIYDSNSQIIDYQMRSPKMQRDFLNWSAAAGISWEVNHDLNIKLNTGKSFRFPVAVELAGNGIHHGTFRHEMGDSTILPENGYQFDLVISQHGTNYLIKLSPYYNYFTNYIFLRPAAEFSPLPEAGQIYRYTAAQAIHTGAELYAEYHFIKSIHIESAAEYIYNLNLDSYLPLPFTPPGRIFGAIEYEHEGKKKIEKWNVGMEYHYFFAQNRTDRNELRTPDYGLLSAEAGIKFKLKKTGVHFIFRANNLLDKRYYNHISRYRILNLPEQGRNFSIVLRIPLQLSHNQ